MGNTYKGIKNSTIIDGSFNIYSTAQKDAVSKLESMILESKNIQAHELFKSFKEDLPKPEKKATLQIIWKGILDAVPNLLNATELIDKIQSMIF